MSTAAANRYGKKLAADVAAVMSRYPDADPDYVRLTLISLNQRHLSGLTGVCTVAEVLPLSENELSLLESLLRHRIRLRKRDVREVSIASQFAKEPLVPLDVA